MQNGLLGDRSVSNRTGVDRTQRLLGEAEGYLWLDLPEHALRILDHRSDWGSMQFEACVLKGDALRHMGRYREALKPLEIAANLRPTNMQVALSLGWCYKRTNRLAQAIDLLQGALRKHPEEPLLHYNLSCYWSLAGDSSKALDELARALELEPDLRASIAVETDFDQIRGNPEFERIAYGSAPQV
jgi:tetratricopeptide (TPR) repeat protein